MRGGKRDVGRVLSPFHKATAHGFAFMSVLPTTSKEEVSLLRIVNRGKSAESRTGNGVRDRYAETYLTHLTFH